MYKVQIQTVSGSYWLAHDHFLGLEATTKVKTKASKFKREFSLSDAKIFAKLAGGKTPINVINHKECSDE